MRYTRYNFKKNRNNNLIMFILKLVGTVVGAGVCGIVLAYIAFNVLSKNNAIPASTSNKSAIESTVDNIANTEQTNTSATNNKTIFYSVQCGYFSNQNNASQILNSLSGKYSAFIYEDQGKFRVLSGVYEANEVDNIINELKNNNIECAKITFSFNNEKEDEYQIASICDGYLRLLNTAFSDDVKSVNTEDFKGWTSKLDNISQGEKVDLLNSLKDHIANVASDITRENVSSEMEYIYTILLNFKDM